MSLLDIGYGATNGLQVMLQNMAAEEAQKARQTQLSQSQQRIDEEIRSNKAREALQFENILSTGGLRRETADAAAAQKAFGQATQRQGEYAMGSFVPIEEYQKNIAAGLSKTPYTAPGPDIAQSKGLSMIPFTSTPSVKDVEQSTTPVQTAPGPTPLPSQMPGMTFTGTAKDQAQARKEADAQAKEAARQADQDRRAAQTDRRMDQLDKALAIRQTQAGGTGAGIDTTPVLPQPPSGPDANKGSARYGGLTPNAVYQFGLELALTKHMPSLGLGSAAPTRAQRTALINMAAAITNAAGKDLPTAQADYAANSAALKSLMTRYSNVKGSENAASAQLDLAKQYANDLTTRTDARALNRVIQKIQGELTPAEKLTPFENVVYTAVTEYAKVIAGSTGSQGVTDTARREAQTLLDPTMSPQAFTAAIDAMNKEMAKRTEGYGKELRDRSGAIANILGVPDQPSGPGNSLDVSGVEEWVRGPDGKLHKK